MNIPHRHRIEAMPPVDKRDAPALDRLNAWLREGDARYLAFVRERARLAMLAEQDGGEGAGKIKVGK